VSWLPAPPTATCMLPGGKPPKQTMRPVFSTMLHEEMPIRAASAVPTTCGMIVVAAAVL